MSKVIAIMNKPKDCESCPFGVCKYSLPLSLNRKGYFCQLKGSKVIEDFEYDEEVHLHDCPLRPVPEKKEVCGKYPQPDKIPASYKIGYNACIDDILGGDKND